MKTTSKARDQRRRDSARPPSTIRLVFLILEGYAYLLLVVGMFVAAVAFLLWGLLNQRPFIAIVTIFVGIPLVVTTFRAVRALFFPSPEMPGVVLTPQLGQGLLRLVEEVRRQIRAPHIHQVVITDSYHASVLQVPRAGVFWPRNTLILGYPLLATVSLEQIRAVIAHELAHITHTHGRIGSWVYRTRRSWQQLMDDLGAHGAVPAYAHVLFGWYVPRLNAESAAVSREQERVADRVAAEVSGAGVVAQALVAIEVGGDVLQRVFWPAIFARVAEEPTPPRPFSEMATTASADVNDAVGILKQLLEPETLADDSHPSLKERLLRLQHEPHFAGPPTRSAASELLDQDAIASTIDRQWQATHDRAWRQRHEAVRRDRERLASLQRVEQPSAAERFEAATLLEREGQEDEALALYLAASSAGHAAASLAAGRVRLEREDDSGLALIEAAMDADPSLVDEGCRVGIAFFEHRGRTMEAHRWHDRLTRHATHAKIAADERETLTLIDRLEPCSDERVDVERLRRSLAAEPMVHRAFLVSKVLRHSAGTQTVLALLTNRPSPDLEQSLRRDGALPEDVRVVFLGRHDQQLQAALEGAGGLVYPA